jgi:hypothetical protein
MTQFPKEELSILSQYHRKAIELHAAMKYMPDHFSVDINEQSMKTEGAIGQFEVGGFVNITRLFTLNDEDIYFLKIRNLVSKHFIGDVDKQEFLKKCKKTWNAIFGPNVLVGTGAKLNGKDITNGDIYDLIVYGDHSHVDQSKYEELEKLRSNTLTWMFVEISFRMIITHIHGMVTMFDTQVVVPILEGNDWPLSSR